MSEVILNLQIEGNHPKTVTVTHDPFVIGRSVECDLQFPLPGISRCHTRLFKTASGVWMIEDMGSKNHTILNNQILQNPAQLNDGDFLKLDDIFIRVILELPASGIPLPKPPTLSGGRTLIGKAKELQEQWIQTEIQNENVGDYQRAIDRLKELVEIAKSLNSAESIEAIFAKVQEVVFRELKGIERLALLIDVSATGQLELIKFAAKTPFEQQQMPTDGSWISRTICQKAFAEQVAIKTSDAQDDERFESEMSIVFKDIRSALAVPLWDENKVVGVLYGDAHLSFDYWQAGGDEDLSFFSTLANLVASSVQRWLLARQLRSEEMLRQKLQRYHSPAVVQHLMKASVLQDDRIAPLEGEISIMFADIVGFTAISERLTPTQIASLLNNLFEEMLQEVFAFGGTLDKFIGDCIMAFWGAPENQEDHAERAVAAARGMLERLARLNASCALGQPIQLRIAINSGKAVIGDVGSSKRVDYTVLGATINLASRMETICPPGEFVISEDTYHLLNSQEGLEPMGNFRFKGIDREVHVYQTKKLSSEK
jgi:adenylate cyclase